eukprot:6471494-Amphidinium_carterae.1
MVSLSLKSCDSTARALKWAPQCSCHNACTSLAPLTTVPSSLTMHLPRGVTVRLRRRTAAWS